MSGWKKVLFHPGRGGYSMTWHRRDQAPGVAHLPGLLVAWAGIVGVNVVQAARLSPDFFGRRKGKSDSDREA